MTTRYDAAGSTATPFSAIDEMRAPAAAFGSYAKVKPFETPSASTGRDAVDGCHCSSSADFSCAPVSDSVTSVLPKGCTFAASRYETEPLSEP